MKARAVTFVAPRKIEVREVEVGAPRPGEVLIRTVFSGISPGTEMLAYRGEIDPAIQLDDSLAGLGGDFMYPFRYGYSCVGECDGRPVFAFHPHQDVVVASRSDVVTLDPDTDARGATLFPLVETALQLSLDAGDVTGAVVAVVGLGPVGLLTALLLERAGASVFASEPQRWRRDLAATVGVHAVEPAALPSHLTEATDGRGVPVVLELSGNPAALGDCLPLLSHEGMVVVGSWYGSKPVTLGLGGEFHRRRLTIRSSQVSTIPARLSNEWTVDRRRDVARGLLRELPLEVIGTHEFAFEDAATAYDAVDNAMPGLLHAALLYS